MKETSDKVFDTDTIIAESGKPLTSEQKKYLELLGAYNLDTQFNQAVQRYDSQLKVQAQLLQIQSDVASLGSANQMAETSKGLGTGAQGVQAAQFQYAVQDQNAALQARIEESRTEFLTNLAENYASQLSALLGEQDENGNFTNILQYEATTDYFLDSLQEEIVYQLTGGTMTDANGNEITDYQHYLVQQGILVQTDDGNYETTELGEIYIEQIMNGNNITIDPTTGEAVDLVTERLVQSMAESWAMSEYGANTWAMMDYDAQEKAIAKYKDQAIQWLMDNNLYVRYTHLGLAENTANGIVFDTMYTPPETEVQGANGNVYTLSQLNEALANAGFQLPDSVDETLRNMTPGEYININDVYYIYDNNLLYQTDYSASNPPEHVSIDKANIYSFGGVYTGNKKWQDWINGIIDAAESGRIEDGTYIHFDTKVAPSKSKGSSPLYKWNAATQTFDKVYGTITKTYAGTWEYYDENGNRIYSANGTEIISYKYDSDREYIFNEE